MSGKKSVLNSSTKNLSSTEKSLFTCTYLKLVNIGGYKYYSATAPKCLELLHQANPHIINKKGFTPLDLAIQADMNTPEINSWLSKFLSALFSPLSTERLLIPPDEMMLSEVGEMNISEEDKKISPDGDASQSSEYSIKLDIYPLHIPLPEVIV
jgi:hypothetical protein